MDELKYLRGRVHSKGFNGGAEFPYKNIDSKSFPDQFDWRIYGAVTPVKGMCSGNPCMLGCINKVVKSRFCVVCSYFFLYDFNGEWGITIIIISDQSVCGSCWSFGTIGAVEGAYFLKNGGQLVRLSQQALIDCSWG